MSLPDNNASLLAEYGRYMLPVLSFRDIVLVRVYYPWKLYVPLMAGALEKTPGKTLLTSITTFRNEPY